MGLLVLMTGLVESEDVVGNFTVDVMILENTFQTVVHTLADLSWT